MRSVIQRNSGASMLGALVVAHATAAYAQTPGAPETDATTTTTAGATNPKTTPDAGNSPKPDPSDTSDEITSTPAAAASATPASLKEAEASSKTAAATATPLSAARGGTLGFPAMGAPGIVAALRLQGGAGQTTKFDVIAQIGQIQLEPWLTLDVVAEKVTTDVPTATFTPNTGTPLPKLIQTDLSSVGFRFRAGSAGATPAEQRRLSECLRAKHFLSEALQIQRNEGAKDAIDVENAKRSGDATKVKSAEAARAAHANRNATNVARMTTEAHCPDQVPDDAVVDSNSDLFEAYQRFAEQSNAGFSLSLGGRLLYRSQEIAGSAPGAAAELTPQFGFSGGSAIFASESFLWLRSSDTETDSIHSTTSHLYELKTTVGAYYKFNAPLRGVQTAPRVGIYGSFARNFWTNPYPSMGTNADIRGYQFEGGTFVSGHFSGGFNGLVQLGLRRGYGVDSEPEFFFSIVPSLGTETSGGST